MHRLKFAVPAAAMLVLATAPAGAADVPKIADVPRVSLPPIPAGLKATCLANPATTASSRTCPVVKYQGLTTWAFSFEDNRIAMALVTYDADNKVVRNVERNGARYIVNAAVGVKSRTVTITGQDNRTITVPWSELGK